eukprot:g21890.t1
MRPRVLGPNVILDDVLILVKPILITCLGDDQLVFCTFGERENPTGIAVPDSFLSNGSFSESGVFSNPGIEVSKEDNFIFLWDVGQQYVEVPELLRNKDQFSVPDDCFAH